MIIVQISDSHIVSNGALTYGRVPTADNLAACVADINAMDPPANIVLHTGDVSDKGTTSAAETAIAMLGQLHCPFYVVPGNHDHPSILRSVAADFQISDIEIDKRDYVIEGYPVRMIALDSTREADAGGELSVAQIIWLSGRLAEAPEKPTVIFMHHPPVKCGVLETDEDGFIGAEALGAVISRYSNVERILCGHIHLPTHTLWNGTIVSTAPSIAMRLRLDLTMQHDSAYFIDEPAYLLHHFGAENRIVTHTIRVGNDDGPHPF
ncbi:MAG: phosphodiesterase [Rhodobacterales bacterium]|nr:phosphodiesterase [Rhodobacterales bacterium]